MIVNYLIILLGTHIKWYINKSSYNMYKRMHNYIYKQRLLRIKHIGLYALTHLHANTKIYVCTHTCAQEYECIGLHISYPRTHRIYLLILLIFTT